MSKVAVCMANGCEEIEGLIVVDILRRAGLTVEMLSINDSLTVKGSHDISFIADKLISEASCDDYDAVILPGGMPGTNNLEADDRVQNMIKTLFKEGKLVAATCAAPRILGRNGIADGKRVTSYPGSNDPFKNAIYVEEPVVVDGNLITSRGLGPSLDFALTVLGYLKDDAAVKEMSGLIVYDK